MTGRAPEQLTVSGLVELTERLTALLSDQTRAFERHRPQDAARRLPEVTRLTNLYRAAAASLRAQPALAAQAPPETQGRLLAATRAFNKVLEAHDRALTASKTVTEGLVRAIAEAVAAKRAANVGYGPRAARQTAPATAITLNQRA